MSSFWLILKQQWTIKISSPLFSIFSLAANLVGSRDHRTQFWKRAIQGPFHQSLVQIGPVASEELIKMWKVNGRTDERQTTDAQWWKFKRHGTRNKERWWVGTDNLASATGLLWTTVTLGSLTWEEDGNLSTRDLVLFTSHPKDGLVVNLYIPHNRRTPLQAEEALGPISMPRGSHRVDPF